MPYSSVICEHIFGYISWNMKYCASKKGVFLELTRKFDCILFQLAKILSKITYYGHNCCH
jgi:hypothetical protein